METHLTGLVAKADWVKNSCIHKKMEKFSVCKSNDYGQLTEGTNVPSVCLAVQLPFTIS